MLDAVGRSGTGVDYLGWICRRSGSGSVVVIQQSAETLTSFHFPALTDEFRLRTDQLVAESLMVAFAVVVHDEFTCRTSDRGFAKQDQSLHARLLDRAHESLRVGVRMSLQMRRMATLKVDVSK